MSKSDRDPEPNSTLAWSFLWVLQFIWLILIGMAYNWPTGSVQEQSAVLAITMTAVEIVLAVLAILLAVGAVFSYTIFKRDVQLSAREAATEEARKSVTDHLTIHGVALIKASLSDAEFVAQLQLKFKDFGIEDFEEADEIEADANWEPEDHD